MNKRLIRGWSKHLDFILLDLACLLLSLLGAFQISRQVGKPFLDSDPVGVVLLILAADTLVLIGTDSLDHVLQRGYLVEFRATIRHLIYTLALCVLAMLIRNVHGIYPRFTFALALFLYFVSSYLTRVLWKKLLRKGNFHREKQKAILIVTEECSAARIVRRMQQYSFDRYQVAGLVIVDRNASGELFEGVPVVSDLEHAADYICRAWIDEVLFFCASQDEQTGSLLARCREMALTVHLYVAIQGVEESKQTIGQIGGYEVLTANINRMSAQDALIKRTMDLVAGIVGCVLTIPVLLILWPMLYHASPGPLFFKQQRIGENGRKFTMYKIRSMYPDADRRKAEYAAQNTHADGVMFKMDFDPRIIGNRILPDGTLKRGIGDFIRRTNLDEMPQFLNVLKGDMSLVGTRPPTVDEWEKYQYNHRARMSMRPGLTGLWQISQRKDNMDFREVVQLDTEYIANWSLGRDARIILKTIALTVRAFAERAEPIHKKAHS